MGSLARLGGRGRELAVLAAGAGAALALLWAAATVQGSLRTAGAVAVTRLSGDVADNVLAEWERLRRDPELPVDPAGEPPGEIFRWRAGEPRLAPLELDERLGTPDPSQPTVFDTLLAEAERRELVEGDARAALGLVDDALDSTDAGAHRPEGLLRAIQLASRLGETETARQRWTSVRTELGPGEAREGIPYLWLAWLALPGELRAETPAAELVPPQDVERLFLAEDRISFAGDAARFELSPTLEALLARLGLPSPPAGARATAALARVLGALPEVAEDELWHALEVMPEGAAARPFLARATSGAIEGFFFAPEALGRVLAARARLPRGFALDFRGDLATAGEVVRPRQRLPGTALDFVLRHAEPAAIAREESSRLAWLRGALVVLACFCAAGGFVTARVLARERRLAELKSAFVAGVSHDLRTPLASILLLAENLEAGRVSEEDRPRYHRMLRREAERLRRLVDGVLDFSRFERGVVPELSFEEVELEPFLEELARASRERVEEAGGRFEVDAGVVPAVALVDPLALRRAVGNLVDNALAHGGGEVELGWAADERNLRLSVADRGPGVPAGRADAIFRPFERFVVDGREPGTPRGLGLGLAIVRSIARGHGGDVHLVLGENGLGEGGPRARSRASPRTLSQSSNGARFEIVIPLEAASR
jgi:signal transduction histidine kinase